MKHYFSKNGFGLIEIIIGAAVITVTFLAFSSFYRQALLISEKTTVMAQSNMLLVEGVEVVKLMRDKGWNANIKTLATSTPYYIIFNGGDWQISTTSTPIDTVYTRWFVLEDVFRSGSDDIVTTGGIYSSSTKKVIVTVQSNKRATTTESVQTYIANIFNN
jgi:hypothetical protein